MSAIASKIFKYRSYTPIPFLIVMFFFANPNIWSIFTGLGIALAGEAIRIWGVSWAGSETRTTGNVGGSFLVISGPFAHVRNPLYVGNILMYTGLGIMSFALFPYLQILGLIFYYFQYKLIVQEEELYLEKTTGIHFKQRVAFRKKKLASIWFCGCNNSSPLVFAPTVTIVKKNNLMIIAGEVSGDMYGAALIHELKKLDYDTKFYGIGGNLMKSEGAYLIYHLNRMAFLGFVEVVKH